MDTISTYLAYIPKRIMALIAVTAIIVIPAITFAGFGPERPTFTTDSPADYVTFNSITDNPEYGDERSFFDVKKYVDGETLTVDSNFAQSGGFSSTLEVEDGDIVMFRAYVHNNAATSLNASGEGIAHNVQFRAAIPEGQATALRTVGHVSADNAQPQVVSDTADLFADTPFSLEYVEGSSTLYSGAIPNGVQLSDTLATTGATLGQDALDGEIPGCFESAVVVTYFAQVHMENYEVDKTVRFEGETSSDWKNEITAEPGDALEFRLEFDNQSNQEVTDVKVGDIIPEGLTYVNGSTTLYNANHPGGVTNQNDNLVSGGINIGGYQPNSNAIVVFKATVADESGLECGPNRIVNQMTANANGAILTDTAIVNVTRTCDDPQPDPTLTCDALIANPLTITAGELVNFTTRATSEHGARITDYSYNFGDGITQTAGSSVTHTYQNAGTYNALVTVNGTADGVALSATGPQCNVSITVEDEPVVENPVYRCDAIEASANLVSVGDTVAYAVNTTASPASRVQAESFTLIVDGVATGVTTPVNNTQSVTHDQAGTVSVEAIVNFTVDGQSRTATSANCSTNVIVEEEPVDPVYECVSLVASKQSLLSNEIVRYTATALAEHGAVINAFNFVFGDGNSETVTTSNNTASVEHAYASEGRYPAGVEVNITVNGVEKTVTSNECIVIVDVEEPEETLDPVYRCDALEANQLAEGLKARIQATVFADNGAVATQVAFDYGDDSDVFVSDNFVAGENGQQTITTDHTYTAAGTYDITAVVTFTVDGETATSKTVTCVTQVTVNEEVEEVCEHDANLAANDPACQEEEEEEEETPVVPAILPNTGATSLFLSIFGTSAIGTMIRGYVMSRRALSDSLIA